MAKQQRISPQGVDKPIIAFQDYLYSRLKIGGVALTSWESYDRVYKTPSKGGLIPELFTGDQDVDYEEVFYNDTFEMTSYFVASDDVDSSEGDAIQDVSLIVQANIKALYSAIAHRADEELRVLFMSLSENYPMGDTFTFNGVEMGIDNVYREFEKEQIKWDDMSRQHVFRLNFTVRYTPECCTDC